jgi:hypothetical protein
MRAGRILPVLDGRCNNPFGAIASSRKTGGLETNVVFKSEMIYVGKPDKCIEVVLLPAGQSIDAGATG